MAFSGVSMPSRSMLRPLSSEESSEDHIKETDKENNSTSNTISSNRTDLRKQDEDVKTRDRQDSSTASNAPLVPISNKQQQTATEDLSRRASDRLRHPFRNSGSKGKKTGSPSEPTPSAMNPWATDKQPSDENHDKKSILNRLTDAPELPFEKLAAPFYLRPFSALDKRDFVPPKEKASAIPVPVESPGRRVSDHYRSTSSSYPSQGIRTPDLLNSPPGTLRNRNFFSIGRYSKSNNRISQLFSSASSTKAELDSTEGYRQPLDAVVVDDQPESLPSSVTDEPKPVEPDTHDAKRGKWEPQGPSQVDSGFASGRMAVIHPVQDPVHVNPLASKSTDTIVKSSSDLLEAPQSSPKEEVSGLDGTTNNPEVIDFSLPPAAVPEKPEAVASSSQPTVPSKPNSTRLEQRQADESDSWVLVESPESHRVPINTSRTSTQQNKQLSGATNELLSGSTGRKPSVAVRLSRRVRKVKFGKWLAKRLRRVRVSRRGRRCCQKPALKGPELTEANLRRVERADRVVNGKIRKRNYNRDVVMVKHADLLRMRAEMEREGVDAGDRKNMPVGETDAVGEQAGEGEGDIPLVILPNGRVSVAPGKETTPAVAKHDTIGRRAAAWFKEQTGSVRGSVDLTRFLLREMKSEMKSAG
ncbi:hypothetical protein CONLIGDRAFT_641527 [Coniochaeta ligniaria NRRL 30616]|uniref:Uncharacterized protein n=1 Tax=Coniochaeta ligniaria NRRL 30616 TaxID=1408157 RepID=A0A1J7IVK9_9PEZI|nr:hypothetical protein CONLIGDRAFT_641527 [Coniochaeta ligniaria NRRL 30616]